MSRSSLLKEDLELSQLREAELQLLQLQKEYAERPKQIAQERKDRECTMPPLPELADRIRRIEHDKLVSRGEVSNMRRDQNRSLLLLLLLLTATGSLVWWGVQLMRG
jgi:hypothetical protein